MIESIMIMSRKITEMVVMLEPVDLMMFHIVYESGYSK